MGNFTIKSKVNRETEIPNQKVKLHIPAEKCCVYEDNKLIQNQPKIENFYSEFNCDNL